MARFPPSVRLFLAIAALPLAGCGFSGNHPSSASGGSGDGGGGGGGGGGATASHDANLASLEISVGGLTPAFDPAVTFYEVGPFLFEEHVDFTPTSADA